MIDYLHGSRNYEEYRDAADVMDDLDEGWDGDA